jgi:hypothetical protein
MSGALIGQVRCWRQDKPEYDDPESFTGYACKSETALALPDIIIDLRATGNVKYHFS